MITAREKFRNLYTFAVAAYGSKTPEINAIDSVYIIAEALAVMDGLPEDHYTNELDILDRVGRYSKRRIQAYVGDDMHIHILMSGRDALAVFGSELRYSDASRYLYVMDDCTTSYEFRDFVEKAYAHSREVSP